MLKRYQYRTFPHRAIPHRATPRRTARRGAPHHTVTHCTAPHYHHTTHHFTTPHHTPLQGKIVKNSVRLSEAAVRLAKEADAAEGAPAKTIQAKKDE